jgi:predicted TIM-barrel fold metal-dependent hydrolase
MQNIDSVFCGDRMDISSDLSRRQVILRLLGLGVGAWVAGPASSAAAQSVQAGRLDLHHHFFRNTPRMKRFLAGWPTPQPLLNYSPAHSIQAMDEAGVSAALLSCPVSFGDHPIIAREDAIGLSREMNEYGARLAVDYKGRFGLFAMLPMVDVDASLREIEYAFDTLKADGVGLVTSYGDRWLGDPMFEPVFDELNRRQAIVYSHPVDGPCCHTLLPDTLPQTVEWNTDTSRAIFSMINDVVAGKPVTSRATRYAGIRFVWSHGGGSLLGLVGRFLGAAAAESLARTADQNSRLYHLRRFYYDTSISANPIQMQALKSLVGSSQIVLGSDFPFVPIITTVQALQRCGLTAEELRGIYRVNAGAILPKWRSGG